MRWRGWPARTHPSAGQTPSLDPGSEARREETGQAANGIYFQTTRAAPETEIIASLAATSATSFFRCAFRAGIVSRLRCNVSVRKENEVVTWGEDGIGSKRLAGAAHFSLFRKRTEEEQRFYEIKPAQRWTMAAMYFGLIASLVFGMHVALAQLQGHGIHPETQTQVQ